MQVVIVQVVMVALLVVVGGDEGCGVVVMVLVLTVVVTVVVMVMRGRGDCYGFCGVINWCGGSYIYQHNHYHHQHHHNHHCNHHHNPNPNHHCLNCFHFVSKFSQFQISFENILFFWSYLGQILFIFNDLGHFSAAKTISFSKMSKIFD